MTEPQPNPDPTIRGGQVNVPDSHIPRNPNRHQPDTPINKKFRPPAASKNTRRTKTKTTSSPSPPPAEGENTNGPAPTS